jgi:hypothetical protein
MNELVITNTRGYWQDRNTCKGDGSCPEPLHKMLGCREGVKHTYYFVEHGRDENGRFLRPYRAWEAIRQPKGEKQ